MSSTNNLAKACCPVVVGEFCWVNGLLSGTAYGLHDPDTNVVTYLDKGGAGIIAAANIVPCGDIIDIIASCDDVPRLATVVGPELLVNGSFAQSIGLGATSVAGPGWTTGYTVPSGGNLFVGPGAGASTWMLYSVANMATVFNGQANPQLLPINGGVAFGTNVGPNTALPIIEWTNIFLENGATYRVNADVGVVNFPFGVSINIDGVAVVPLTAPAVVNLWTNTNSFFTFAGVTGYHRVGLYSNSGAGAGNDHAFDNISLKRSFQQQLGATTPLPYSSVTRALIDQILQTAGCNDDRRDTTLSNILTSLDNSRIATPAPTAINGVIARSRVVASGSLVAGLMSVSFTNVGSTAATVLGVPLATGQTVSFSGYFDEVTRQMVRLPAIAYTASATAILSISTQN